MFGSFIGFAGTPSGWASAVAHDSLSSPEAGGTTTGSARGGLLSLRHCCNVEAMSLVATLEHPIFHSLVLSDPSEPSSWTVITASGESQPLAVVAEDLHRGEPCFISVAQEADGQHRFISLAEAVRGGACELIQESEVKAKRNALLLYARRMDGGERGVASRPLADTMGKLVCDDLAPHSMCTNYSIVPWLSLGRSQRLILCDEATLKSPRPQDPIFDTVTLIVNCHENAATAAKYKVGVKGDLEVVAHAVHTWFGGGEASMLTKNDEMQRAIWSHLEGGGSVAVHCLAGIHRAACIVACHFLFRRYVLGHVDVPEDPEDIYRKLQSVRPHVAPAYEHVLRRYSEHVRAAVRKSPARC